MLLIKRRHGTCFFIGDDIKISIMDIAGGNVTIGIAAPKELKIHRDDIINKEVKMDEEE
jgi:carbon storage regulator